MASRRNGERKACIGKHFSLAGVVAALVGAASIASADPGPRRYPFSSPVYGTGIARHRVEGYVAYFNRFDMTVQVGRALVPVRLHQGTAINPTGLTITRGMFVRVAGRWQGKGAFHADWINLIR